MKTYSQMIINATKCKELEVEEIEDILRNDILHSELDHLTLNQINIASKKAYKLYLSIK